MKDFKGPLPTLEIDRTTKPVVDQSTVDQVLSEIYEQNPDLFRRLAEREISRVGSTDDEVVRDFWGQFRKILTRPSLAVQGSLFWEARRRARLMSGIQD